MSDINRRIAIAVLLVLTYFASFPADAQSLTTPLTTILNLTTAISPWFYGVVAVGVLSIAIVRTWGGRELDRK